MKIIYQQTPMSIKKTTKICSRCDSLIPKGETYYLYKKEVICNVCIAPDEFVTLAKLYKGTTEKFGHHGFIWDIGKIKEDISSGLYNKMYYSTEELISFNNGITITRNWLNKVEIDVPGILIKHNKVIFDVLDGHHRLQKRFESGCSSMEFFELTLRDSFKYLIGEERELMMFLEIYVARRGK